MTIKQIKEMNIEELKKFIEEKKSQCVMLRFDIAAKQMKNHRSLRSSKKDIAMAMTVLKELEITK